MEISASTYAPMPNVDVDSMRLQAGSRPEEVARSFEAVFASLMIKEMRSTLSEGFFGSEGSDVLGGLFDVHMGEAMVEGRGLGIKQMVLAHLEQASPSTGDTLKDD